MVRSKRTTYITRIGVVTTMVAASVALAAGSAEAAPRTLATWHMDETSGSVMLDSSGNHPGTIRSPSLTPVLNGEGDPTFVTADAPRGYTFDGKSAKVTIPNAADLNPKSDNVHIAFSMKTTFVPAVPDWDLFRKGTSPAQLFKIELMPNGQITCTYKGSSASATIQAGPDVHDGLWHRVSCDKSSTAVTLTIDGKSFIKKKVVGSISNSANLIVASHGSSEFYHGVMDELVYQIG